MNHGNNNLDAPESSNSPGNYLRVQGTREVDGTRTSWNIPFEPESQDFSGNYPGNGLRTVERTHTTNSQPCFNGGSSLQVFNYPVNDRRTYTSQTPNCNYYPSRMLNQLGVSSAPNHLEAVYNYGGQVYEQVPHRSRTSSCASSTGTSSIHSGNETPGLQVQSVYKQVPPSSTGTSSIHSGNDPVGETPRLTIPSFSSKAPFSQNGFEDPLPNTNVASSPVYNGNLGKFSPNSNSPKTYTNPETAIDSDGTSVQISDISSSLSPPMNGYFNSPVFSSSGEASSGNSTYNGIKEENMR